MSDNKHKEAGATLVKGATILAVAGIISKILGAFFRIPLTNLIGAEGMSYYGVAYPVYSFFLILAVAGLPVAISRMVSERIALEDYKNAHKAYKVSFYLMFGIGMVSFLIVFFGADMIAEMMKNPGAALSLKALSPALLLAPIVASFRGYFQGQQNMMPTAISEVAEQFLRVGVGLALSFTLVKMGLEYASAGATFGATAGLVFALVIIAGIYFLNKKSKLYLVEGPKKPEESSKSILKELAEIAVPITIGSTIMPLMMMLDAMIIMRRLQATGWDMETSQTLYGLISGFCDPLIAFPGVFIDAISISLIPAVTAAFTLKKQDELNKNIQTGIKTMMVVAYPCAIGLIVLARPILYMLYAARIEEAEMAVTNLQILSLSILTLSTMRTFSSSLQGIGKMVLPVRNLFIGSIVKVITSYILVGVPALNINGAAIGSVLAYLVAAFLNYRGLRKYADVNIDLLGTFCKPLLASGLMGAVTWGVYRGLNSVMGYSSKAVLLSIIVAVAVYFVLIFVTKTISREEAALLPKGGLIIKVAEKMHLL